MYSCDDLIANHAIRRLFDGDFTLWSESPTEITNRLGWLTEPAAMIDRIPDVRSFVDAVRAHNIDRVVWCGMGGSSLFPELLAASELIGAEPIQFRVLDSSHPHAVLSAHGFADEGNTLFVCASKSGGTIETRSHLEYFWHHFHANAQFAAVTDAGSALDGIARERNFLGVFNANPNIGGRYSALSHFGVVAAALLDVDISAMLGGAAAMLGQCSDSTDANPALQLGALMGGAARSGRDKLVLDCNRGFGAWLEQLIAESTGKLGLGILPVPGTIDDANGPDRVRVSYGRGGDMDLGTDRVTALPEALGAEIIRWEIATAIAGATLAINPFDQPDVEAAKLAAGRALDSTPASIAVTELHTALADPGPHGYVTLQAFVDPQGPVALALEASRVAIRDATGQAVTAAVGPRYLHSTGQLHKGGPNTGISLQIIDADLVPLAVPGRPFGFDDLIRAQAAGDFEALTHAGHRVFRVDSLNF